MMPTEACDLYLQLLLPKADHPSSDTPPPLGN